MKITSFRDIPSFTQAGSYECDYPLDRVWVWVTENQGHSGLDIDPDFQRPHVWTHDQQQAWLEFFLRGGKTGRVLYFNKPSWHHEAKTKYDDFVLVDGKQRLEAIRRFLHNELTVFGSYYREYTDKPRGMLTVKINVNDLQTKAEVLHWYLEMNSGGTPHKDSEIARVRDMLNKLKGKPRGGSFYHRPAGNPKANPQ